MLQPHRRWTAICIEFVNIIMVVVDPHVTKIIKVIIIVIIIVGQNQIALVSYSIPRNADANWNRINDVKSHTCTTVHSNPSSALANVIMSAKAIAERELKEFSKGMVA